MSLAGKKRKVQIFYCLIFIATIAALTRASGPSMAAGNELNETCLSCHSNRDLQMTLESGDSISLYIDAGVFEGSVHGEMGYSCNECHTEYFGYPHPKVTAKNRRELTLDMYPMCTACHRKQIMEIQGNVHMVALTAGNPEAAVCTDCHGTHNIHHPAEPRSSIPQTCRKCHAQIYGLYENSVHGAALIGEGNPDVPSCIDCHGAHKLIGPNNSLMHLFSPKICANCHGDANLMEKYGISTEVLDTYITDYHGTTVTLFQEVAPDQETNKPVCIDCHGVHDILPPDDPGSHVIKENLLDTCRKCHPDATVNFPASWLSHDNPSPRRWPIVYYVTLFYKVLIPSVIGGMFVFVMSDFFRQRINARRKMRRE